MARYQNLQAMRCIAAMMVLFIHALGVPEDIHMGWAVPFLSKYGPAGVDIFFVISGFIITTTAHHASKKKWDGGRLSFFREFATKRLIRIYPIYWIVLILAILASPWVWLAPATMPNYNNWAMFFLFESSNNKVMAAWTLVFELYFYLIVSVTILLLPKHIYKGLLIWCALTLLAIYYFNKTGSILAYSIPFSPVLIEFMLGIFIAFLLLKRMTIFPLASIGLGILLFLIGADVNANLGNWQAWYRTICFGPASALIIYGVLALEVKTGWVFSKNWQLIGDASYSIYIWHQLIIFSIFSLFIHYDIINHMSPLLMVLIWTSIAFFWAIGFYFLVEKQILKYLEYYFVISVREIAKSSMKRRIVYNCTFAILMAFFVSSAFVYNTVKVPKIKESLVLAAWPPSDSVNNSQFSGDPQLLQPVPLTIPRFEDTRLLKITCDTASSSSIYVSYYKEGKIVENWYNFEPHQPVYVAIDGVIDNQRVWLSRDANKASYSVKKLELIKQ